MALGNMELQKTLDQKDVAPITAEAPEVALDSETKSKLDEAKSKVEKMLGGAQ